MKVLGLFSGIGGFEYAFQNAGYDIVGMCEIEPFCQAVLRKRFPGVPVHHDVRELSGAVLSVRPDVIVGGFPCQDISVAGRGAGLGGERSGLWREYYRLIRELGPDYVVAENVPALRTRGADQVLADLEAADYAATPFVVGADDVGAPHRRKRVWIIAHAKRLELRNQPGRSCGPKREGETFPGKNGQGQPMADTAPSGRGEERALSGGRTEGGAAQGRTSGLGVGGEAVADACGAGFSSRLFRGPEQKIAEPPSGGEVLAHPDNSGELQPQGGVCEKWRGPRHGGWWAVEPDVGRVAHGVPLRMDRIKSLGNAIVPVIAQAIAQAIKETDGLI